MIFSTTHIWTNISQCICFSEDTGPVSQWMQLLVNSNSHMDILIEDSNVACIEQMLLVWCKKKRFSLGLFDTFRVSPLCVHLVVSSALKLSDYVINMCTDMLYCFQQSHRTSEPQTYTMTLQLFLLLQIVKLFYLSSEWVRYFAFVQYNYLCLYCN